MIFIKRIDYDFWATFLKLFSIFKRVTVQSFILLSSRSQFHLIWAIIRPTITSLIQRHNNVVCSVGTAISTPRCSSYIHNSKHEYAILRPRKGGNEDQLCA